MKLVLFAHTPPPLHGQSYMVAQLLDYLGGDARHRTNASGTEPAGLSCYHVNARVSGTLADVGRFQSSKPLRLMGHILHAWHCRCRLGADVFFHVPAPAKRSALVRDWLVLALCRPFFRHRICWFQATGLGDWLETKASPSARWLTRKLLGRPDLSIVLGEWGRRDAVALASRRIIVVPNTVPDPCPPDGASVLRERAARAEARAQLCGSAAGTRSETSEAGRFRLLFLSLCTRDKGLFDAMDGVLLLNQRLAGAGSPLRVELNIAGEFPDPAERAEFDRRARAPGWRDARDVALLRQHGFVEGAAKLKLLRDSDGMCFPTYYAAEGFPLVLIEAMAWGLHIITTRWRIIPELFPEGFDGLVEPQQPAQIADAIERRLLRLPEVALRRRYEQHYAPERCFGVMRQAILELERGAR